MKNLMKTLQIVCIYKINLKDYETQRCAPFNVTQVVDLCTLIHAFILEICDPSINIWCFLQLIIVTSICYAVGIYDTQLVTHTE